MKELYNNWYRSRVALIEQEETDHKRIIGRLKDLLDEWDDNFRGGDAKAIHRAIDRRIREEKGKMKSQISSQTGFSCTLPPPIVKEIYYFMAEKFIKGDLQDFQAIFSNSSNTVTKPIQWLILNKTSINLDRGNQTALNVFIKLMLGKLSNSDRRKAKDLFIDKQGYFIKKSLLKPDKDKIGGYGFETGINEIIKKADH